jgi:hypothetical protein
MTADPTFLAHQRRVIRTPSGIIQLVCCVTELHLELAVYPTHETDKESKDA